MPQVLFTNCQGRTGPDYSRNAFDTLLVENGLVAAVGMGLTLPPGHPPQAVDLGGAVVFPAFADAHVHFLQTGLTLLGCSMDGAVDLAEVFDRLATHARRESGSDWLLGWNLDETTLREGRLPTPEELDRVVPDRPVWLSRVDLHSAVPNGAAIRWAEGRGPDCRPEGGRFLRQTYAFLCSQVLAALGVDTKHRALELARRACLRKGVTTVHALEGGWGSEDEDVQLVADFLTAPGFHGIVYHQSEDPSLAQKNGWPRLGGCLMIDGSFGSGTAALYEPYDGQPDNLGALYRTDDDLHRLLRVCSDSRLQLAMHAIGDRAIEELTAAHVWAAQKWGSPPLGHRIEHFELPTAKAIRQASEAGLRISVQPAFEVLWGGPDRMYAQRLGRARARRTNPFRKLLAAGLSLAGGSDSPVTAVDPFLGVQGFVTHPTPEESIPLNDALHAFLLAPHEFGGESGSRGRLAPGFAADFVCLSHDPFLVPLDRISQIEARRVFVAGVEVSIW